MSFLNNFKLYKISEFFCSAPKAADELYRILKTDVKFRTSQTYHGLSIVFYLVAFVFVWVFYFSYTPNQPVDLMQVSVRDKKVDVGKLIVLPTPRYTDDALRTWASEAVNNIFNFTFLNFDEQVNNAHKYFTEPGYAAYKDALARREFNKTLQQNKQIQNVTVTGQIIMIGGNKGYFNKEDGKRYWQLKIPAIRTLTSGRTITEYVTVEMMVTMSTNENGRSGFFINELRIQGQ